MSKFFAVCLRRLKSKDFQEKPFEVLRQLFFKLLKELGRVTHFCAVAANIKKYLPTYLLPATSKITECSATKSTTSKHGVVLPFLIFKHLENRLFRTRFKLAISNKLYTFIHDTKLETIWTVLPIIVVLSIAVPSFILLYALDAALDSVVVIKAIGHQWYWNYECEFTPLLSKFPETPLSVCFDSYMIYDSQLKEGQIRLLEVDNPIYIPYRLPVDLIVTSVDVIHSWAVPSLGIKIDGLPGRLNHSGLFIERKGVFYGQCSELCGVNHGFMPIKVVSVSFSDFMDYCYNFAVSNGKVVSWGFKSPAKSV
jgi:heme/copper-type cytochrome/quinol oxidase subunit 2